MSDPRPLFAGFSRSTVFRLFFFAAFLFLIYQLLRILSPFFTPIMVAITLALIFYPLHAYLNRRLRPPSLAAGASTGLILLMVIVPAIFFVWLLIHQSAVIYPWAQERVQAFRNGPSIEEHLPGSMRLFWGRTREFLAVWELDFQDLVLRSVAQIGGQISAYGTRLVKNFVFLPFEIMIMAFTLFFLFRDGERISHRIVDLIPMETAHKEHVLARLYQTLSAVVRGVFITASLQGLLAGIGYASVGIRFAVLLGFATAFLALIPFVGAAGIWIPVSAYLYLQGATAKGIMLFAWGILVVSTVDNVLRPILIGERAKLPVFLLFFGILGGLQVYGFIGILIGPLMIASVLAFAKIYREELQRPHAPPPEAP